MAEAELDTEYEFHLDPFGQQPGLWNLYTQLTWCYAMPDGTSQESIVDTLRRGLARLSLSFPWIAGHVVKQNIHYEGDDKDGTLEAKQDHDHYVIEPLDSIPRLVVKDHRQTLPPWSTYKDSKFPVSLLDENDVAPRNTKPVSNEFDPKPVLLLQATFITGGLFLTFSAQHGTLDVVGQGEMIRLLDKACNGIEFTSEEIELGNRDRRTLVKLLTESEEQSSRDSNGAREVTDTTTTGRTNPSQTSLPSDVETHTASTSEPETSTLNSSPKNIWSNFSFRADSLTSLKAYAMKSTSSLPSGFISTDDALSAFIWQCFIRARSPRYPSQSTTTSSSSSTSTSNTLTTTFARTVDARRYLSIPSKYPGNLATKTHTTYAIDQILHKPLGLIASTLRQAIDPNTSDIGYEVRKAATEIVASLQPSRQKSEQSPKSQTGPRPRPPRDLGRDIAFSSWSKIDFCWNLDFALGLGMPESVRRPAFAPPGEEPMEGLVYLLPKAAHGEIGVVVCLREDDVQRLKQDKEWNKFAEFVG